MQRVISIHTVQQIAVFLDDINMPMVNEWGDQPTLEAGRQLIADGTFSFLDKDRRGDLKIVEDLRYIAAGNSPAGGKNDIPAISNFQTYLN